MMVLTKISPNARGQSVVHLHGTESPRSSRDAFGPTASRSGGQRFPRESVRPEDCSVSRTSIPILQAPPGEGLGTREGSVALGPGDTDGSEDQAAVAIPDHRCCGLSSPF